MRRPFDINGRIAADGSIIEEREGNDEGTQAYPIAGKRKAGTGRTESTGRPSVKDE